MANSIVSSIDPNFLLLDTYSVSDENLIANQEVTSTFNPETDYVEYYIYGLNNSLLYPSLEDGTLPYLLYSLLDNDVYVDPSADLQTYGFNEGGYNTIYNLYSNRLNSSFTSQYFISEISSDRTEIRLDSNDIDDADIISSVNAFISERSEDEYFPDFLLNFGSNRTVIANNIILDGNTVLIKLYDPLPPQFRVKSTLWIVEEIASPLAYNVTFEEQILEEEDTSIRLKGPNLNLDLKDQINNSTEAVSLSDLDSSPLTGSYQQLQSLFNEEGIQINVDYTEYSNFVNFSSIKSRIENFEYKLQLIESYRDFANEGSNVPGTGAVFGSKGLYDELINDTITNFDGYEYFLYFTSGSKSWPKSNTEPPFQNLATADASAISWYNEQITSASSYDELNQDNLFYDIPEYLRNDSQNQQYIDFVEMIGQHFDNIWIYLKDISNKYNADNRIDAGISKDLISQALRDFSLKIYQNNFSSDDIFSSFLGLTPSGSLFPFPNITGSLPTPNGFEYVDTLISSSTDAVPLDDVNKRIYKRLYHNLPYLLKSKGTIAGIKTLLNIYGIPDTILQINEFGGKDKVNENNWDHWQHKYNYEFQTGNGGYVESEWELSSEWGIDHPQTIQFRFKTPNLDSALTYRSQSLWTLDTDTHIVLEYTGSGNTKGSFDGSIPDPYKEYATLKFIPNSTINPTISASIYLPFFDGEWWSVMATFDGGTASLYAADNLYNGTTGTEIGYYGSGSVIGVDPTSWGSGVSSNFAYPTANFPTHPKFSGSLQEIRYYNTVISKSRFEDYTMNPHSFEGNSIESGSLDESPNQLAFRASLGGELYTGSNSIHPKVTGSWTHVPSFSSGESTFLIYGDGHQFGVNREYIFFDQFPVGIKNRVNDKIRPVDLSLPTYDKTQGALIPNANTLSNQQSIQQDKTKNDIYTNNLNLLEVTFSPQNELNDDIISQLGYFNMGNLIGDPRDISSRNQSYPELDKLRQDYFLKYAHENYDFNDYVRLIKFFDNSLFKMIKDFVPARTSLASGITIKPHILERQKYPLPQAYWEDLTLTGSTKSFPLDYNTGSLQVTSGGNGGSFNTTTAISASLTSGGSGYFSPASNYSVTAVGGGGSGLVISIDSIDESSIVRANESLLTSITQTSNNYAPGLNTGFTATTSLSGITVQLQIIIGGGGSPVLLYVVTDTSPGVEVGDTLTVPKAVLGGTQDLIITLQASDLTNAGGPINGITLVEGGSGYTSLPTLTINGNPGSGAEIDLSLISKQNWKGNNNTPVGVIDFVQSDNREFINGELSGSTITITTGDLSNPTVSQDFLFTTSSSGIETADIGFRFQTNPSYQLELETTNTSGVTGGFQITDVKNINYVYYTSPDIKPGSSFKAGLTVNSFSLNNKQLLTPNLSAFNFKNISPFNITASIYENTIDERGNLVVSNNAVDIRPGTLYQDLDYSYNITTPVNFEAVISESATKASVPDSNYSTERITLPRYGGSKSISSGSNLNSIIGGLGALPNVEQLNTAIYSINFGGGTSPEILGLGGTSLSDILLVGDSKENITTIPQSDPNYLSILDTSLEPGDIISFYQYGNSSADIPQTLEVVSTDVSAPPISSYIIPSTDLITRAIFTSSISSGNPGIDFVPYNNISKGVYTIIKNSDGNYETNNFLQYNIFTSKFITKFSASPNSWYVSVYNTLNSPVTYDGSNATEAFQFTTTSSKPEDPLGFYGVAKITGVLNDTVNNKYGVFLDRDLIDINDRNIGGANLLPGDLGILIWQSPGNSIIVKDSTLSGLGASLAHSKFAPKELTENLDYISRNYTNKS